MVATVASKSLCIIRTPAFAITRAMISHSIGHVDNAVFWPPLFPRNICLFRRRPGTRRAPNGYSLTNDESRAQKTAQP
jgi:hypothetical protein